MSGIRDMLNPLKKRAVTTVVDTPEHNYCHAPIYIVLT